MEKINIYDKKTLKLQLLNDEFDLDKVKFKIIGYDFELSYSCSQSFEEGRNGGDKYCITITRIKIDSEISALFADSKEEAIEEVMEQLDELLNLNHNDKINKDIKYYEDKIIELKQKLEEIEK